MHLPLDTGRGIPHTGLTMTNTNTTCTDDATLAAEGAWHGRDIANSLRGVDPCTDEQAYNLNALGDDDSLVWHRIRTIATKYRWTGAQRAAAYDAAIDAYYNRMLGVD